MEIKINNRMYNLNAPKAIACGALTPIELHSGDKYVYGNLSLILVKHCTEDLWVAIGYLSSYTTWETKGGGGFISSEKMREFLADGWILQSCGGLIAA